MSFVKLAIFVILAAPICLTRRGELRRTFLRRRNKELSENENWLNRFV